MIRPASVSQQLTPALGPDRADDIASVANGLWLTLQANPLAASIMGQSLFTGLAVLFGVALQTAQEAADYPNQDPRVKDVATRTVNEMQQIVLLVNVPTPASAQEPPSIAELIELLSGRVGAAEPAVIELQRDPSNGDSFR
jgi:hypothetical protein